MLNVKITYEVTLTPKEFGLISKALRFYAEYEEAEEGNQKAALELQDRLFKERNSQVKSRLNSLPDEG